MPLPQQPPQAVLHGGHERRVPREPGHLLAEGYFSGPVFAAPATGELFARHTCVVCGHFATTWAAFRAHRDGCRLRGEVLVPDDDAEEEAA